MRRHLERCPGCQGELTRFEKTLRMLHSVEEVEVPEGFLSGVYEKIEGRRERDSFPEKTLREGYGLKWKIPVQAFAMVAIVFLALYLTKMTSNEPAPMKTTQESKPSVEERKGPAEIKTPTVKEKKLDRELPYKRLEKAERSKVSNRPNAEPPSEKAENGSEVDTTGPFISRRSAPQPAAAPPPEEKATGVREQGLKLEEEKKKDERADRELKGMNHSETAPSGATGAPRPALREAEKTCNDGQKIGHSSADSFPGIRHKKLRSKEEYFRTSRTGETVWRRDVDSRRERPSCLSPPFGSSGI